MRQSPSGFLRDIFDHPGANFKPQRLANPDRLNGESTPFRSGGGGGTTRSILTPLDPNGFGDRSFTNATALAHDRES